MTIPQTELPPPEVGSQPIRPQDAWALALVSSGHSRDGLIASFPFSYSTLSQLRAGSTALTPARVESYVRTMLTHLGASSMARVPASQTELAGQLLGGLILARWEWLSQQRVLLHSAVSTLEPHISSSLERKPIAHAGAEAAPVLTGADHPFATGEL